MWVTGRASYTFRVMGFDQFTPFLYYNLHRPSNSDDEAFPFQSIIHERNNRRLLLFHLVDFSRRRHQVVHPFEPYMHNNIRRQTTMGGTRYSRNTRNKDTLHTGIQNSPRYGNKACNLCQRARYPDDLSFKVSKYKTCGDVHLELSLIDPSTATCEAGQDAYRELCCPQTYQFELPSIKFPAVSVAAGLFLFWIFTRRLRKVQSAPDRDDDESGDGGGKKYQRMKDDQSNGSKRRKRSKSRERTTLQRSRSKESKFSKSSKHSSSTKGSGRDMVTEMVNTSSQNKKVNNTVNAAARDTLNIQQRQQQRLQQQYFGTMLQHRPEDYYNLDDETTAYGDSTISGRDTVAGESEFAVITQVV
jgi:hypothetical protein